MNTDIVLLDLKSDITMRDALALWHGYTKTMPEHEVFIDGDAYAIVARPRGCKA